MGRQDLQAERGGTIGLRASGVVAKLAMEIWLQELKQKLENA